MKKTLIAMAAVAVAGVASAQSSVTLYGVADASLAKSTGSDAKLSTNGLMNNGNSRWGIKGTEDLGGGLSAGFNFEAAVNLGNGATDANYFQRHAFMFVKGGFGQLKLGRTLSPSFYAVATWELTGAANYSAVANMFGFAGPSRTDGAIAYTTPNMGGFDATLGYVMKGNDANGKARVDLNARYVNGPIAIALGYDKQQDAEKGLSLGGKYTFGNFAVAASYMDPAGASKGFTIGGTAKTGPVDLTLDIARDTEAKDTNVLVEVKYPLSKRTFAYAAFLRQNKDAADSVNNLGLGLRHNF